MEALSMNTVDCVLISNWHSLIALPFYVENCGFRGVVYATEPVVQFGRLALLVLTLNRHFLEWDAEICVLDWWWWSWLSTLRGSSSTRLAAHGKIRLFIRACFLPRDLLISNSSLLLCSFFLSHLIPGRSQTHWFGTLWSGSHSIQNKLWSKRWQESPPWPSTKPLWVPALEIMHFIPLQFSFCKSAFAVQGALCVYTLYVCKRLIFISKFSS